MIGMIEYLEIASYLTTCTLGICMLTNKAYRIWHRRNRADMHCVKCEMNNPNGQPNPMALVLLGMALMWAIRK